MWLGVSVAAVAVGRLKKGFTVTSAKLSSSHPAAQRCQWQILRGLQSLEVTGRELLRQLAIERPLREGSNSRCRPLTFGKSTGLITVEQTVAEPVSLAAAAGDLGGAAGQLRS